MIKYQPPQRNGLQKASMEFHLSMIAYRLKNDPKLRRLLKKKMAETFRQSMMGRELHKTGRRSKDFPKKRLT